VTLAVIGIIYGALVALAQTDVKRLVAYSSVSHMGFIVLGLFAMNRTGMDGAVIQMVNHGLTTGALFACVGVFYERYHTREMAELGGLWKRLPLLAFFFMLSSLGSAAVPGLNGFVGEFPILTGMFDRSRPAAVLAATGMILGAYYLLWMLQSVLFGPLREPHHGSGHGHGGDHDDAAIRPVGWHEIAGLTPLMVLIVVIGVYPRPFFERLRPSVAAIAAKFPRQPSLIAPGVASVAAPTLTTMAGRSDKLSNFDERQIMGAAGAESRAPRSGSAGAGAPLTPPLPPGPRAAALGSAGVPACCDPDSRLSLSRYRKVPAPSISISTVEIPATKGRR
jgi:NADH-quinone oxidoreductase subunit M